VRARLPRFVTSASVIFRVIFWWGKPSRLWRNADDQCTFLIYGKRLHSPDKAMRTGPLTGTQLLIVVRGESRPGKFKDGMLVA
jgi:hypothetical protein